MLQSRQRGLIMSEKLQEALELFKIADDGIKRQVLSILRNEEQYLEHPKEQTQTVQ